MLLDAVNNNTTITQLIGMPLQSNFKELFDQIALSVDATRVNLAAQAEAEKSGVLTLNRCEKFGTAFVSQLLDSPSVEAVNLNDSTFDSLAFLQRANLRSITLSKCRLKSESLDWCRSLGVRSLRINDTLSSLGDGLRHLNLLTALDLSNNRIAGDWTEPWISDLDCLESINLSHNAITKLPPALGTLSKLQTLDVSHNRLAALPHELGQLQSLKQLIASNNDLRFVPETLAYLNPHISKLDFSNNRNIEPSMLVSSPLAGIKKYLHEALYSGEKCNSVKIVIVGQEGVGKTCIVNALRASCGDGSLKKKISKKFSSSEKRVKKMFKSHRNQSTDGIDVHRIAVGVDKSLEFPKNCLQAQVFDFGGQEVYTMTHTMFLSNDAVYVLAFNPLKQDSENRLGYWLASLAANLGKKEAGTKSTSFKALVVATHADALGAEQIGQRFDEILRRDEAKDLKITRDDCIAVSNATGAGIAQLTEMIRSRALSITHLIGVQFPKRFFELERFACDLAQRMSDENKIPVMKWSEFLANASTILVATAQGVQQATGFLHKQGLLLHFASDRDLREHVILDPQWLPKLMSTLVSFKTAGVIRNGLLKNSDIRALKLWSNYPPEIHPFLMSLLMKFAVLVPLDATRTMSLVPAMLSSDAQTNHIAPPPLGHLFQRRYSFRPFLPRDFFPRLLVRLLGFISRSDTSWQWGLITYTQAGTTAQLTVHEREIELAVWGHQHKSVTESFTLFHSQVLANAQFWSGLSVTQLVVLRDGPPLAVDQLSFAELDVLPEFANSIAESAISEKQMIAEGGFGRVYRACFTQTVGFNPPKVKQQTVAIKELFEADADAFAEFTREVDLMSRMAHANIVRLIGVCFSNQRPSMVMEYMDGGTLRSALQDGIAPQLRKRIALDVALGMAHLHSHQPPIVHRDLKSPNVLLATRHASAASNMLVPVAKIADFGMSLHNSSFIELNQTIVQNPRWLAPEIMRGEQHNHLSDVYSFAIVLWELAMQKLPFDAHDDDAWRFDLSIEQAVTAGTRLPLGDIAEDLKPLVPFMERCWVDDMNKRPEFNAMLAEMSKKLGFHVAGLEVQQPQHDDESAGATTQELLPAFVQQRFAEHAQLLRSIFADNFHERDVSALGEFMQHKEHFELVSLDHSSPLYAHALSILGRNADSVQLIVNPQLAASFARYKDALESTIGGAIETALYSCDVSACNAIMQQGFNPTYSCNRKLGYGLYFSKSTEALPTLWTHTRVIERDTQRVIAEFSRCSARKLKGKKPAAVLLLAVDVARAHSVPFKTTIGEFASIELPSKARFAVDGRTLNLNKRPLLKHNVNCIVEQSYTALLCLVLAGHGRPYVATADELNARPCSSNAPCGGPDKHMLHGSKSSEQICVPLRQALQTTQVSTSWQVIPRYLVRFQ